MWCIGVSQMSISRVIVADDGGIGNHPNTCPAMSAHFPSVVFRTACSSVVNQVVPSCQLCPERCDLKGNNNMCVASSSHASLRSGWCRDYTDSVEGSGCLVTDVEHAVSRQRWLKNVMILQHGVTQEVWV